jgi:hypothetical protein
VNDTTDAMRREMIETGQPARDLAADPDQKWNTAELQRDFEVLGYQAPFVVARHKETGELGSLEFTQNPRLYFGWRPHK